MSKYIIEVEDVPFSKVRIDADNGAQNINLYRAKGFNSLVFDKEGLDRLTPLDTELEEAYQKGFEAGSHEATTIEYQKGFDDAKRISEEVCQLEYNKGLNDMWEAVKQLIVKWINGDDDVFGDKSIDEFIETYSASEAIAKLKAYEEQEKADEIKVGDIITDGKINYLVIDITDKSYVALQGTDFEPVYIGKDYIGLYHNLNDHKDMQKIAEEINNAMKVMKGEQRNCSTCKYIHNILMCNTCINSSKWAQKGGAE